MWQSQVTVRRWSKPELDRLGTIAEVAQRRICGPDALPTNPYCPKGS